ncbi:hypothetical protein GEMRC1_014181 [Eukaryota sp. GEM-RC1]
MELCCLFHFYFLHVLRTEVSLPYDLASCLFEVEQSMINLLRFFSELSKVELGGSITDLLANLSSSAPPKSRKASSRTNTKRVRELISDNELSRALNMLARTNSSSMCSSCSLTKTEVLEELNRLHPRDESLSSIEIPESAPFSGFPISSISNAALSSPATGGGISHWHAKNTGQSIPETDSQFLVSVFTN